jgi:hypothetical protein
VGVAVEAAFAALVAVVAGAVEADAVGAGSEWSQMPLLFVST